VSYFKFLYNYFLKFIVHEINSEMVKFGMLMLIVRENDNMVDANIIMDWTL
jgi:hypothetical protein